MGGQSASVTDTNPRKRRFVNHLWVALGTFFLGLGIIGIVIPILPTTPFLLLAAGCYLRGSERMYRWMLTNKVFGRYLDDYRQKRGMSVKSKVFTLSLLWAVIGITAAFTTSDAVIRVLLVVVAIGVSAHILTIKTKARDAGVDSPP